MTVAASEDASWYQAVLVLQDLADDLDEEEKRAPSSPFDAAPAFDPQEMLAAWEPARVPLRFEAGAERHVVELPREDPSAMDEVVETLYALGGWAFVDDACENVALALVGNVAEVLSLPHDELRAIAMLKADDQPLYLPPQHVAQVADALAGLYARAQKLAWPGVLLGLGAVYTFDGLFANSPGRLADAGTPSLRNPEIAARVFAQALIAIEDARGRLVMRVVGVLRRVESEAIRLLEATLRDARGTILRETMRHFAPLTEDAAIKLLSPLPTLSLVADAPIVAPNTPSAHSDELQQAMRALWPLADAVLKLGEVQSGTPPTASRFLEEQILKARLPFARELARHAAKYPVLCQLGPREVRHGGAASPPALGALLLPVLIRAWNANEEVRKRLKLAPQVSATVDARHPEDVLARLSVDNGADVSVWHQGKYLECAMDSVCGDNDDVAHQALSQVRLTHDRATGSAEFVQGLAQCAAETAVMQAAEHFLPRMLPLVNIVASTWHIAADVSKFGHDNADFYCALDPRDSLIDAAPSLSGLAAEIAQEIAFAGLGLL